MTTPTLKARAETLRSKLGPAARRLAELTRHLAARLSSGSRSLTASDPLLQWMTFTGLTIFAFVLMWFFGFLNKMLSEDPTHISAAILVIYIATSVHCFFRAVAVSREAKDAEETTRNVVQHGTLALTATPMLQGRVADHIRDLKTKASIQGGGQLNQSLLLRVLAERLRGSNAIGAFASDSLMKLGLLGTIVGFIMMLAPMATLDPENQAALKTSMGLMSGGMAVAMYTTLVGLVGSVLLKIQYQFLETATSRIFTSAVELTEVHVIPVLEREKDPA